MVSRIALFLMLVLMSWMTVQGSELKHNPFQRPALVNQNQIDEGAQGSTSAELKLGGVVLAGSNSLATVNGRIYRMGKTIDGMKLEKVDEDGATFIRNGARLRLELEEPQLGESNDEN